MKHTSSIKTFDGELAELSERLGDLYYDCLSEFLLQLSCKLRKDGNADYNRGRKRLACQLHASADLLEAASEHVSNAWDISSPFVERWLRKHGLEERP